MLDFSNLAFNNVINIDVGDRINDLQFLERELKKWLNSKERKLMIEGEKYYDYEHFILNKRRLVIGDEGEYFEDVHLPNNKFIDNQYSAMVDQKVNYLLAKPLTFKTENKAYNDALTTIFDKGFHKTLKNLGKDVYNGGIGWLYPYYNEQGEFKIRKFKPYEILPFWKNDDHDELDFAVRYYEMLGYMGRSEHIYKFVEVYDTNGIHRFNFENGALRPDYQTSYFEQSDNEGNVISYNWDRVPLIPFKANNNETPLLKRCKSLQDGINQLLSEFGDGMNENANGSSILVIKNYDGTNLGEFRRNLAQYKAVKVRSQDGADGGVSTLSIDVNCNNFLTILSELRKALITNCRGYDINELKSSGSPNEMTIKSVYSQIDLDANELETEFQASFEQLLWFVNQAIHIDDKVDIVFDRDMMINESQVIADVNASSALISKRTALSMHPYVTDVEKELKELDKEQQKAMEQFGNAQIVNDTGVDFEDNKEDENEDKEDKEGK